MDWFAKSAWIYEDATPDFDKCKKYGIKVIYIDPRSNNVEAVVSEIRAAGLTPGAYFADSWSLVGETGAQFADWINVILTMKLPRGTLMEAPPCMLDIERKDVTWASNCISRYRAHQPARPTSYTNAPFQGNYIPHGALVKYNMNLYVQLYYGDMSPADASAAILEQIRLGMPPDMTHPFYDAAHYGSDQRDGCYFTLERMP